MFEDFWVKYGISTGLDSKGIAKQLSRKRNRIQSIIDNSDDNEYKTELLKDLAEIDAIINYYSSLDNYGATGITRDIGEKLESTVVDYEKEYDRAMELLATPEYEKGISLLEKLAVNGDANSMFRLGVMYYDGNRVPKNYEKAVEWYRKAADAGDSRAVHNLGYAYENGEGVEKNLKEAVRWYELNAEQGDIESQFSSGVCYYLMGNGTGPEMKKAAYWFIKAA